VSNRGVYDENTTESWNDEFSSVCVGVCVCVWGGGTDRCVGKSDRVCGEK